MPRKTEHAYLSEVRTDAIQAARRFSMSGLDKADKNCLPARVYLTRPARLVCRAGQVTLGFFAFLLCITCADEAHARSRS